MIADFGHWVLIHSSQIAICLSIASVVTGILSIIAIYRRSNMPLTKHELLDELTNMLIRIDKLMQEYTAQGHHERVVSLFHAKNHITEVRLKEEMEEEKDEPSH